MTKRNISGTGNFTVAEGAYGNVSCLGNAAIYGGGCDTIRVIGNTDIHDNFMVSEYARFIGVLNVHAELFASSLKLTGLVNANGLLSADTLILRGERGKRTPFSGCIRAKCAYLERMCKIDDFTADSLYIEGDVMAEGLLRCGHLTVTGAVTTDEVEAESILIFPRRESSAEALHAEKVTVSGTKKLFQKMRHGINGSAEIMRIEEIEADDIDIDYVEAQRVSGLNVRIGKNCAIGRLEYTNKYEADEGAEIKEIIKMGGEIK